MILIPCRPGILDLRPIGATVQIARLANKPSLVVLDACPAQRGGPADEAAEAVRGYGAEVAPFLLAQHADFAHALASGLTA